MELRHFHDPQRVAINWEDQKIVVIESFAQQYARTIEDKIKLLETGDVLVVAWPGVGRTDVFELDDETRADALDQLRDIWKEIG